MEEMNVLSPSEGNKFYQCTVLIESENPDNGKPKKIKEVHLVEAVNLTAVENKIAEQMRGTMFPWHIVTSSESKIQYVY